MGNLKTVLGKLAHGDGNALLNHTEWEKPWGGGKRLRWGAYWGEDGQPIRGASGRYCGLCKGHVDLRPIHKDASLSFCKRGRGAGGY